MEAAVDINKIIPDGGVADIMLDLFYEVHAIDGIIQGAGAKDHKTQNNRRADKVGGELVFEKSIAYCNTF